MDKMNNIDEELENLLLSQEEAADVRDVFRRSHFPVPCVEDEWNKIAQDIQNEPDSSHVAPARSYKIIIGGVIAIAACWLLVFLLNKPVDQMPDNIAVMTTAEKNHSVLVTRDDGEPTVVETDEVSFLPGHPAHAMQAEGKMVSMVTPRGKDCHLVLPDGTKVWLNDESQLDFPSRFGSGKRIVRLKGEAFFEVTKDKKHPFVVENDYFTTTVLGTVFNVRAYDEKDANIILVSGRVALNTGILSETKYIEPGQMAVCHGRNQWDIHQEDTYPYTQRKDGYFYFDHLSLHKIMAEIGRWYNKTVVFENPAVMSLQFHFVAERKQSLESIIESLNLMDGVNIELGKNEIVVR